MTLSACSENGMPGEGPGNGDEKGRFLTVGIADAGSARAGSAGNEAGSDYENKIGSLRFYFFDSEGNPIDVDLAERKNYVDCTASMQEKETGSANTEKRLQATFMINPRNGRLSSMAAVANHEKAQLGSGNLSLAELCAKIGDYRVEGAAADFVMSSSSYAGTSGQICTTAVEPENLCETEAAAAENPITVYIERVVAKARLKTAWNMDKVNVVNGAVYDHATRTAVELHDSDGNPLTVGGQQVYAIFTGWNVTGKADKSYLFKKINTETAWALGWIWNQPALFRSYWATNPAGTALGYIAYNEIGVPTGEDNAVYCAENAADNFAAGTKKGYDPDTEVSNRTQAILAAVLVTLDANSNAAPAAFANWSGSDYTQEVVKTAMLNATETPLYTKEGSTFAPIRPEHVELVTATQAGMADDKSENSARYLSYLQPTAAAREIQFYAGTADDAALTTDAVNDMLKEMPGAKVWKNGMTYYYTDIRHLGLNEEKGLFGVVRNHVYDININSVTGLGTPVYDPNETIVPQKPANDETYIAAEVNILAWKTVSNDVELTW